MARDDKYKPLISKATQITEDDELLFYPPGHPREPYDSIRPPSSIATTTDTAITAHEQTGILKSKCCSCSWLVEGLSWCVQGIQNACSAETSKSLTLSLFYLLAEVLLCIALIINWHTKTKGSFNITEATVQMLLVVYMAIGILGMAVVFLKRKDTKFVIFTAHEHQASKYLMSSVYAFGGGSLFMTVLFLFASAHCGETYNYVTFNVVRFLYTLVQMLFLQRFSLATFHRCTSLVFLLIHILGTNMSIWIYYLIEETNLYTYDPHEKKHTDCIRSNKVSGMADDWREYMTPFSMEFCLICAGLIYSMVSAMKHFPSNNRSYETQSSLSNPYIRSLSSMPDSITSRQSSTAGLIGDEERVKAEWQREVMSESVEPYSGAYPGFLFGVTVSVIMVVSALVIEQNEDLLNSLLFHHTFLSLVSISQVVAMVVMTRSLKYHDYESRSFRSDDTLLVISFTGMFAWELLCIISALSGLENNKQNAAIVILIHNIFNLTAVLVQCIVIIRTLRFKSRIKANKTHMLWDRKGTRLAMRKLSQAVIYLFMVNIGYWILDSFFELKHSGYLYYPVGIDFYNGSWHFWSSLLYPLNIFFRFHSATLLFEIWVRFKGQAKWSEQDVTPNLIQRKNSLPSIDRLIFNKPEQQVKKKRPKPQTEKSHRDHKDIYRKYWSK